MTAQVIYAMTHLPTGKVYVGQTAEDNLTVVNTQRFGPKPIRFAEHLGYLARGDHRNWNLQAVWTGNDSDFDFQVIDTVPDGVHPREVETGWIKAFPAVFNIRQCNKPSEKYQRITRAIEDEVVALLKTGMTGQKISVTVGISPASVTIIRKRNNLSRVGYCMTRQPSGRTRTSMADLAPLFATAFSNPVLHTNGGINVLGTMKAAGLERHRVTALKWLASRLH